MNGYLIFILAVLIVSFLVETFVSLLNLRSLDPRLPAAFKNVFDETQYARSQQYTRTNTRFSLVQNSITTMLTIVFILMGGFNWVDIAARSFGAGSIITGIIYTGLLVLISGLAGLPFTVYATFVIEERFGFNTTSPQTFILDIVKTILLLTGIGAPLLAFILWFFENSGPLAWLYCWAAVVGCTVVLQFLGPALIMPLFNKFTPLAEGALRDRINDYVKNQQFKVQGIYTMDGSKRSTKLNAFFTGFGRFRRIVFFDTLTEQLSDREIVAVLAHEMGHFRLRHIFIMMGISIVQTGLMLYILSLFIHNRGLFDAFGMEHLSVYASLIFFGFLYAPISMFLSVILHALSRRHEYEADSFAASSTCRPQDLISGLKKLSVSNLANLTPHPLHVFLNYSHPPVLSRIEALAQLMQPLTPNNGQKDTRYPCEICGREFTMEQLRRSDESDALLCGSCLQEEKACGCADE